MQLRKICNHPYLIDYPLIPNTNYFLVDEGVIENCGKMQVLDMLLKRLQTAGDHKVSS